MKILHSPSTENDNISLQGCILATLLMHSKWNWKSWKSCAFLQVTSLQWQYCELYTDRSGHAWTQSKRSVETSSSPKHFQTRFATLLPSVQPPALSPQHQENRKVVSAEALSSQNASHPTHHCRWVIWAGNSARVMKITNKCIMATLKLQKFGITSNDSMLYEISHSVTNPCGIIRQLFGLF